MLGGDPCDLLPETPRPRPYEHATHGHAVRRRDRGRRLEPFPQLGELPVHVGVQRQLSLDHERADEQHARAAIGGEAARKVERMFRLLPVEQRHDDAAVGDRTGPAREAPRALMEEMDVRELHRSSWYGTEARITFGSTSSSRFTYSARWLCKRRAQPRRISSGRTTTTSYPSAVSART